MIVWIIFFIIAGILICSRLSKSFGRSYTSLGLNIASCLISFGLARICANSMAIKGGKEILQFLGNEYGADLVEIASLEEFFAFLGNIAISIVMFYIFYLIISIILTILKHLFIYKKVDDLQDKQETNVILKKLGIVVSNLISVGLTFIVLITPFGIAYNCIAEKTTSKVPFVSESYFDKLTQMSNNKDVQTSEEIKWTSAVIKSIIDVNAEKKTVPNISIPFSKTHFLPTVIADVGSTAAKHWKNGEEFLGYQYDIPSGREGKLYLDVLDVFENWNKEAVSQDVQTIMELYKLLLDYGIDEIQEDDGLLDALSNENFMENLFVILYSNNDFAKLIPITVEYGLGTTFDYVGLELDENYSSNIDVTSLSEEDVRREARIVSGIIKTTLEIYETNQKIQNKEITIEDVQRLAEEVSKLKDSKVFGDIANEIVLQLTNSISALEF